jgi:hypothetical protein
MKSSFFLRHLLPVILLLPLFVHASGDDGPITANLPLNEVSIRAYRYFHKEWPVISGETWYKAENELMVVFSSHAHRMKAFFNLKGAFLYSLEYYAGKDLSTELATLLRNKFPSFRINTVTEVSNQDQTAFYITIENSAQVKTLSVINGKVQVLSELINGGGSAVASAQN